MTLDFSASDADGDSLSYELCPALTGGEATNVKPWPASHPPYDNIIYTAPFTFGNPMNSSTPFQLNPGTGILSCTPAQEGVYLIAVCCHEWRNGTMINTVRKEVEVTVTASSTDLYRPNAGNDVIVIVGNQYHFHAMGASNYTWTPATFLDNSNIADPTGTFTQTGKFRYTVHGVTDSSCAGDDDIEVTVLPHSAYVVPNAFTPNGDGTNDYLYPIAIGNCTLQSFSVYNRLGNCVYQCDGQGFPSWDGKYKGKSQDMGVFSWQIKYLDESGNSQLVKGNVTLIR
jgi:gliding motility-associated-like protein